MTSTRRGRDLFTGEVVELTWQAGKITAVQPVHETSEVPWMAPGFLDLQVNGWGGVHFGDPELTTEQVMRVARPLAAQGVTEFVPTLITDSAERMRSSLGRLAQAMKEPLLEGAIAGIHLEGPYLSSEDGPRGAHPLTHCKDPEWGEFCSLQEAAEGHVKIVTLAPERAGAIPFITRLVESGVRVAIGHTAASKEIIDEAVQAGASLSTHLGNGVQDQMQRHHNPIFAQLGNDRLWASLIVDGHHLPPHVVQIFARAKGLDRIILVSDAVQYTGLPAGIYDGGYRQFEVREDGFIGVVGEPRLAGSGLLLTRAIENFTRYLGFDSPQEAIRCVTVRPRRWLFGTPVDEQVKVGDQASFVLFDWNQESGRISIRETFRRGASVYDNTRN